MTIPTTCSFVSRTCWDALRHWAAATCFHAWLWHWPQCQRSVLQTFHLLVQTQSKCWERSTLKHGHKTFWERWLLVVFYLFVFLKLLLPDFSLNLLPIRHQSFMIHKLCSGTASWDDSITLKFCRHTLWAVSTFLRCFSWSSIFFLLLISCKKTLQVVWISLAPEGLGLETCCLVPLWPPWNQ